jgi:tRNA pseudouridine55 synthase
MSPTAPTPAPSQPTGTEGPGAKLPEPRGLIVVNKPQGITSRKALNIVEQRLDVGALGHCGSLDPLATGVLVLVVGKARKVQDLVVRGEKVYDMTVRLGATSDTDDAEGRVVPTEGATPPTRAAIEAALLPFRGEIEQVPPTYSAVKVEGKRMHREARKGRPVEAPPRPVVMHELRLDRYEWPELDLHLRCGAGTYARALARDLGKSLGTGGYMSRLVRTRVGSLELAGAAPPEEVTLAHLQGIEIALRDYPRINVPLQHRSRLLRGQALRTPANFPTTEEPCFAWVEGEVVASVAFVEGGTHYRTKKLLV